MSMRVLFIPFEFLVWQRGGAWPYSVHLGMEEGLRAHGIELTTIPGTYELPSSYQASWLYHAARLCEGKTFDQVWVYLRHSQLDDSILNWIADIAPVRIGFVMESLAHLPEELESSPQLREIEPFMERQMRAMTHVLAFDERDSDDIRARGKNAMWCPWSIPQRFLGLPVAVRHDHRAAFFGILYGRRAEFLGHPSLRDILAHAPRTEDGTELPEIFDQTAMYYHARLHSGELLGVADLDEYLGIVRRLRRTVFDRYLTALGGWAANVVLPAGFKGYSNRIVESAAARVPVLSWNVPDRPRNSRLFEPGREILLFDRNDPDSLAEQLRLVLGNPDYARDLVHNLHETVLFRHTSEVRVEQILRWVATGTEPDYMHLPVAGENI